MITESTTLLRCPRCDGERVVPIIWGEPGTEAKPQIQSGKMHPGGCLTTGNDPTHHCQSCHLRWTPQSESKAVSQLTLSRLLDLYGITDLRGIKLVRHQDSRIEFYQLLRIGGFDIYQSNQSRDVFKGCSHILSFTAAGGTRSLFMGMYAIKGVTFDTDRTYPESLQAILGSPGAFWYDFKKDHRLADLEQRMVIDWGTATRSWHQWADRMAALREVTEIRAHGRWIPFTNYDDVALTHAELRHLASHHQANPDWHHALAKVRGIYLIVDESDGRQYVGSAYGDFGLWGRWVEYAEQPHGGNQRLVEILAADPQRYRFFRYSILKTMPISTPKDEVVRLESLFKRKLGSRAFGLNDN